MTFDLNKHVFRLATPFLPSVVASTSQDPRLFRQQVQPTVRPPSSRCFTTQFFGVTARAKVFYA